MIGTAANEQLENGRGSECLLAPPVGPAALTASEARRQIETGNLDASTLADACLQRVSARDNAVRAWTFCDPDLVRSQAATRDGATSRGPLHGLPVGIKDILSTTDMPTTYNSPHFQNHHPNVDAAVVALLRAAGAVIFGKNDTVEFAVNGRRARTRNPHDLTRTPGGSSSGSAAAVADFQVPLSVGTQTGGSVIRPASYCGVYALKPTWNAVSAEGMKSCAPSIDTLGFYARSAQDLDLLCDVFGVEDAVPRMPKSLEGARIAFCPTPVWREAEGATHCAIDLAIKTLRAMGAEVVTLELPEAFAGLPAAHKTVMQGEMRTVFRPEHIAFGNALYPELHAIMTDRSSSKSDLRRAYDLAATCRARFDELADTFTAVLTPSVAGEAPVGPDNTGAATFNRMWTLLHTPCVNIPAIRGPSGLPVGVTLTGPRFSDRRVLAASRLLGAALAPTPFDHSSTSSLDRSS